MKKQGSMREQIEHWRKRALTAEEANASVGAYVDQERRKADAVSIASSRIVYMAGADAAGIRMRLEDMARTWSSWSSRLRSLFRSVRPELDLVEGALSGRIGTDFLDESEKDKARIVVLASSMDSIRAALDHDYEDDGRGAAFSDLDTLAKIRDVVLDAQEKMGVTEAEKQDEPTDSTEPDGDRADGPSSKVVVSDA